MEIGQLLHNNPVMHRASDFAEALLAHIRGELARVYWNVNQKTWAGEEQEYNGTHDGKDCEPLPPGIEWRLYYNWGGSPDDDDWNQELANKPNMAFEGVEFRWYKRFGRSLNVNVDWSPEEWNRWFERCMQTIRAYESQTVEYLHHGDPISYPDPAGVVPVAD